jgi:hypothetical protein
MKVNGFTLKRALRVHGRGKEEFPTTQYLYQLPLPGEVDEATQIVLDAQKKFEALAEEYLEFEVTRCALQAMQATYNTLITVPYEGRMVNLAFLVRMQGVVSEYIAKWKTMKGYRLLSAPAPAAVKNYLSATGVGNNAYRPHAQEMIVSEEHVQGVLKAANKTLLAIENALAEGNSKMVDYSRLRTIVSEEKFTQILSSSEDGE